MASTNKTTNLELSQFLPTDKPTWLSDYNGDMLKLDAGYSELKAGLTGIEPTIEAATEAAQAATNAAEQATTAAQESTGKANEAIIIANNANTQAGDAKTDAHYALEHMGNLENLTTTAKNNLVAAINEVNAGGGGGGGFSFEEYPLEIVHSQMSVGVMPQWDVIEDAKLFKIGPFIGLYIPKNIVKNGAGEQGMSSYSPTNNAYEAILRTQGNPFNLDVSSDIRQGLPFTSLTYDIFDTTSNSPSYSSCACSLVYVDGYTYVVIHPALIRNLTSVKKFYILSQSLLMVKKENNIVTLSSSIDYSLLSYNAELAETNEQLANTIDALGAQVMLQQAYISRLATVNKQNLSTLELNEMTKQVEIPTATKVDKGATLETL